MTALSDRIQQARAAAAPLMPGLLLCATIAAAASFLGEHYAAPAMLFALLLGMAFHFMEAEGGRCAPGVEFSARFVLRLGVGLLGIRIALDDLVAFGWQSALAVAGLILLTILSGFAVARMFGRRWRFGLLTGGAVAICGASAALAIAAVIPHNDKTERNTLFTVIAVTTLSTVAMVIYPILFNWLNFSDLQIGFMIGATIHDVAQVVGAGYSVSDPAGDAAVVVKLFRVALLPVVLMAIVLILRATTTAPRGQARVPLLPWFMVLFLLLSVLGSLVALPAGLVAAVDTASRGFLVTAVAALGVKTALRDMAALGSGHIWTVSLVTLVLLLAAMAAVVLLLPIV